MKMGGMGKGTDASRSDIGLVGLVDYTCLSLSFLLSLGLGLGLGLLLW